MREYFGEIGFSKCLLSDGYTISLAPMIRNETLNIDVNKEILDVFDHLEYVKITIDDGKIIIERVK